MEFLLRYNRLKQPTTTTTNRHSDGAQISVLPVLLTLALVCTYRLASGRREIALKRIRGKRVYLGVGKCSSFIQFSLSEKVVINMESGKAKMNPAVLGWNWKYQCEHVVL